MYPLIVRAIALPAAKATLRKPPGRDLLVPSKPLGRPRLMKQIEKQLEQGPGAFEGLLKEVSGSGDAMEGFREMVFQGL